MTAQLNHTIVYSSDRAKSARFLAGILGLPAPVRFGPFEVVELDNAVSLDFAAADGPIQPQHYAFLISEADFDAVFGRVLEPFGRQTGRLKGPAVLCEATGRPWL
jgi:hypothetical protein